MLYYVYGVNIVVITNVRDVDSAFDCDEVMVYYCDID